MCHKPLNWIKGEERIFLEFQVLEPQGNFIYGKGYLKELLIP